MNYAKSKSKGYSDYILKIFWRFIMALAENRTKIKASFALGDFLANANETSNAICIRSRHSHLH